MNSADLKIRRAEKHYDELSILFKEHKPFRYFLEADYQTGHRATFAKRSEDVTNDAAIIIGDIIYNLRSALDHTYWYCTNTFANSEGEKRKIQFPITSTAKALQESVLPGLPTRVSESFTHALASLKPYREGGNNLLCAIHDLDVLDKHKLLIPTGSFTKIKSSMIQAQVPDFPSGIMNGNFGSTYRDVVWKARPMKQSSIAKTQMSTSNMIEKELDVPIEIVIRDIDPFRPALEVLKELIYVAKKSNHVLIKGYMSAEK